MYTVSLFLFVCLTGLSLHTRLAGCDERCYVIEICIRQSPTLHMYPLRNMLRFTRSCDIGYTQVVSLFLFSKSRSPRAVPSNAAHTI